MQKVIPGSSRAAVAFIIQHWKALGILSALPVLIILAINFLELEYTLLNLVDLARMKPDVEVFTPKGVPMALLLSLLKFVPLTWLLVRITNYWTNQSIAYGIASPRELPNTIATLGYGAVFGLSSMFLYFATVLILFIVSGVGPLGVPALILGPLLPLLVLPLLLLVYVFYRFAVALPGVAVGERPHIFKDVWPLSKGESMAIPARIMLSLLLYFAVSLVFSSFTTTLVTAEFLEAFRNDPARSITSQVVAEWTWRVFPYAFLSTLISTAFFWFTSTLLCEAYVRLRKRGATST